MARHAGLSIVFAAAAALTWPAAAQPPPAVDLALVVAVDASGSIDEDEFRLQKEGIGLAVTSKDVLSAIQGGIARRIAIAYVEWGSPGAPQAAVGWTIVKDQASAEGFAAAILTAPRTRHSYNAIGDAIALGTVMIKDCPCRPTRAVIDISGDNRDMNSISPAPLAREAAVVAGITVNALAILQNEMKGPSGKPLLVEVYEREVIGGPGAFAMAARERADFARALRQKMVREIVGGPSAPALAERQQPARNVGQ